MHAYEIPAAVKERVVNRMGKLTVNEIIDASRCAFIVIDMQNYFCAEGFPAAALTARNVDTVLIAGTLTNVCCESSARDAMMLGYKVALISDCNATLTYEEHCAALNTFMMFFGDVMTGDEAVARLNAAPIGRPHANLPLAHRV